MVLHANSYHCREGKFFKITPCSSSENALCAIERALEQPWHSGNALDSDQYGPRFEAHP